MARGLKNLSIADLVTELRRRQNMVPQLQKQREKILAELQGIDEQIAVLEGIANGRAAETPTGQQRSKKRPTKMRTARRRAGGSPSLTQVLVKVMDTSKPMSVEAITAATRKSGYKSKSKNFRGLVAMTLSKDDRFKRVGRGQYVRAS